MKICRGVAAVALLILFLAWIDSINCNQGVQHVQFGIGFPTTYNLCPIHGKKFEQRSTPTECVDIEDKVMMCQGMYIVFNFTGNVNNQSYMDWMIDFKTRRGFVFEKQYCAWPDNSVTYTWNDTALYEYPKTNIRIDPHSISKTSREAYSYITGMYGLGYKVPINDSCGFCHETTCCAPTSEFDMDRYISNVTEPLLSAISDLTVQNMNLEHMLSESYKLGNETLAKTEAQLPFLQKLEKISDDLKDQWSDMKFEHGQFEKQWNFTLERLENRFDRVYGKSDYNSELLLKMMQFQMNSSESECQPNQENRTGTAEPIYIPELIHLLRQLNGTKSCDDHCFHSNNETRSEQLNDLLESIHDRLSKNSSQVVHVSCVPRMSAEMSISSVIGGLADTLTDGQVGTFPALVKENPVSASLIIGFASFVVGFAAGIVTLAIVFYCCCGCRRRTNLERMQHSK